jgi:hypothetical protein
MLHGHNRHEGAPRVRSKERIEITLRRVSSLTVSELDDIWAVTSRYIDTDRSLFEARIRTLPEVGLWQVRDGSLIGLVNFDVYPVTWEGRVVTIIFTSSVVIDERFRGRHLVLQTGLRILLRAKLRHPLRRAYWLFDTFSYKSYLLLPRNLRIFWPRRDQPTPADTARFLSHLAQQRYGANWRPETGVVSHSGDKRLLPTAAPLDAAALSDPDVRFFDLANPRHRDGDRLVCLAPLSVANLTGAIGRMLRF